MAELKAKGASQAEAPTGEAPTGSEDSKGAKAPTGSESVEPAIRGVAEPVKVALRSRSQCVVFHEQIVAKIELGLTAQRIYQDWWLITVSLPSTFGVALCGCVNWKQGVASSTDGSRAGQEMQIDYGQGARCKDHTGKYRKTYVFRMVLSHSRKGYTEAVTRLTTESLIRSLENAFRAIGGVPKIVVFDNASSAVKKADWYDPELNPKITASAIMWASRCCLLGPLHRSTKAKWREALITFKRMH